MKFQKAAREFEFQNPAGEFQNSKTHWRFLQRISKFKISKAAREFEFQKLLSSRGTCGPSSRAELRSSSSAQDSTLKISGFNSQNLGSSVPGLSGAQLSKSQLQGVLQEISPENFEIQNLRENFKVLQDFEIQKLQENSPENFKIQKLRENSPENFKIQKLQEDFKIQKLRENSPENFKIQKLQEDFKIQKLRENSPEDFKFKISLEISPEDFKFKISLEISPENFKIQNPRENFKIQKLRENSPENFKIQKLQENSPENFEISKAAREFQNLLHPSRLNSQKPQDSTLKNFKTQLSKTQGRKKNHEIMKFVFCPKQQKNSF